MRLLCVMLAAGCSFLKATHDPTQYFVLSSDERRAAVTSPVVIGIDRVELPEYLMRDELVTRSTNNELTIAEYQHWGEPLKDGFSRTLRHDLENELGTGHVVTAPFDPASRPPLVIDVEVRRFERIAGQGAILEATWTLRDSKSGLTVATHQARVQRPVSGDDPRATVAALSGAVAALAGEVAGAARAQHAQR